MIQSYSNYTTEQKDDVLVIGLFEGEELHNDVVSMNSEFAAQIKKIKQTNSLTKIHTLGAITTEVVYLVGLGKKDHASIEQLREKIAECGQQLKKDRVQHVGFLASSFENDAISLDDVAVIIGESIALSQYEVLHYKEKTNQVEKQLESITIYGESKDSNLQEAGELGYLYGTATNRARALVNLPGNLLTPTDLAEEAQTLAEQHQFELDILEREDMERLGMGALLAVAAGSDQPPKMIVLSYKGDPSSKETIGLVGKGLTFDSGGISIKPRENMHAMKMDMGGAAAVIGAMDIIGSLKPKVNVLAVIPSSENLLNGSALKPGDVIRSLSGKTIEVRNTDAEGRLILADGVTYAKQLGATSIIDVATLTGAVLIALGECTTGAITNNEDFMEEVLEASAETGEWIWRLPSYQPYKDMLKTSDVADLNNAPGRNAGSITAGLFIGEFAENTPWVHLDIAGTAWQTKATHFGPLGGTGAMARTLAQIVLNKEE
ncbi:leucyl aminopeptidase [Bacillus suaedae]|uniref:Probable cytosol aminopeptidase n=1 Tax=Halalkalibacter suaedae TaxID=2822140 RepID=A0A940WSZ5_9BACI|nr:leucyl aminopeptidase [Bacillus suaedae]MBP3949882.1 leucyl aminopeptidase [Bacillus suaedae]